MLQKNRLNQLFISLVLLCFFSCAKSEKNDLKEAQLCLNSSAPSQARSCMDKISNDQSPQAYKLRCAAVFISEGFNTPSSFISALDQITNPTSTCTGGCSSTVVAVSGLSFKNADNTSVTDRNRSNAVADEAFNYCSLADTNIYMQISSLFKIGTTAANIAYGLNGGATPSADQIKAAVAAIPVADLGALTVSTYNASCGDTTNASDSTKKYCDELGYAVAKGGTQDQIGTCVQARLLDPNAVCTQY